MDPSRLIQGSSLAALRPFKVPSRLHCSFFEASLWLIHGSFETPPMPFNGPFRLLQGSFKAPSKLLRACSTAPPSLGIIICCSSSANTSWFYLKTTELLESGNFLQPVKVRVLQPRQPHIYKIMMKLVLYNTSLERHRHWSDELHGQGLYQSSRSVSGFIHIPLLTEVEKIPK